MTSLREDLFRLLPLVYQQRDADPASGHALAGLLEVIGEQGDVVAADLALLYDDWFIETCADEWVPYVADLLGVHLLHPVGPGAGRYRALVANTLDLRRRKGTVAVLEQLAFDVTGWPAAAEEYLTRVATTQHLAHVRPGHVRTPNLHEAASLELIGGPFDAAAHTAEVRRLPTGRYGIGNIGLHVWRQRPQRVTRATARPVADPADGRYRIDPVGRDLPLANPGSTEEAVTSLAREEQVPALLRRRALHDELEALRHGSDRTRWFGDDPVVEVFADLGGGIAAVPIAQTTVADLSDPPTATATGWPRPAAPLTVAVDPVLGRVSFRAGVLPASVEVTATHLVPGLLGAGPYERGSAALTDLLARAGWWRAVGARATPVADAVGTTIAEAVAAWNAEPPGTVGVIALLDSRTYVEDLRIEVPAGSELLLVAAAWPAAENASATTTLTLAEVSTTDRRPHLLGDVAVVGVPGQQDTDAGRLTVDGLLVEGRVVVEAGDLRALALHHVTVLPGAAAVTVEATTTAADDNGRLTIEVDRSVLGAVVVPARGPALVARSSVVDAAGTGLAIEAPDSPVDLERVTVLGGLRAGRLDASDCVLAGTVSVRRQQVGCLRFSFLSEGAVVPRRYRCQPDLALRGVDDPVEAAAARMRLTPAFTSVRYGEPGYARLDDRCDVALRTGASNGAAMGAGADLEEPHRHTNLAAVLEEYLRLGLDAGVIHET